MEMGGEIFKNLQSGDPYLLFGAKENPDILENSFERNSSMKFVPNIYVVFKRKPCICAFSYQII